MQAASKLGADQVSVQLQHRASSQMHEKQSTQSSTKSSSMDESLQRKEQLHVQLALESGANEHQQRASSQMHEQQNQIPQPVKEHAAQQQKKHQMKRKFCSPGAMSAYRELRKKHLGNMVGVGEKEKYSLALESALDCTETCEGGSENEVQLGVSNHLTMDDGGASLHEHAYEGELQLMPEIPAQGPKTKKKRGPTKMAMVHARTPEERQPIVLNKFGQPVGPTQQVTGQFLRFLGTIAKDSERAPLDNVKWPDIKRTQEDAIWNYILQKYMVPEEGKKWVMGMIGRNWRIHKCRTKRKYYYAHSTTEERQNSMPLTISGPQFTHLIQYWDDPSIEETSKRNRDNRRLLDDMHTMGPKSYAMLRHELQEADVEHCEPFQAKVYKKKEILKRHTKHPF